MDRGQLPFLIVGVKRPISLNQLIRSKINNHIINVKRKISIHIIDVPTRLYFEIPLACLLLLNVQTVLAPGRQMTVDHQGKDKEDIYSPSCEYIGKVEIFWILERVERQT